MKRYVNKPEHFTGWTKSNAMSVEMCWSACTITFCSSCDSECSWPNEFCQSSKLSPSTAPKWGNYSVGWLLKLLWVHQFIVEMSRALGVKTLMFFHPIRENNVMFKKGPKPMAIILSTSSYHSWLSRDAVKINYHWTLQRDNSMSGPFRKLLLCTQKFWISSFRWAAGCKIIRLLEKLNELVKRQWAHFKKEIQYFQSEGRNFLSGVGMWMCE